jgi:hypothetical protein
VDALLAAGSAFFRQLSGSPQKIRTLNKCRGATALKVTEGNVRQELASGPASFTLNLSSFYLACSSVRQPIEAILFTTRIVRSVEHNKERFKCFPKAN